jgi:hypothetical protein
VCLLLERALSDIASSFVYCNCHVGMHGRVTLLMLLFSQGVENDIRNCVTVDICKEIEDMRCPSCKIVEWCTDPCLSVCIM